MGDSRAVARVDLVCSACRGALSASATALTCASCLRAFPVDDGIADFSGRQYFDDHPDPASLSEEARRGYENESACTARAPAERDGIRLSKDSFRK